MYEQASVGVVVPAYNEEKLIGQVIETMPAFVDKIIVVDDRSNDATPQIVQSYAAQIGDRLELICHKENLGVGAAIGSGYQRAVELALDVTAVMAGDGQMAPDELEDVIVPIVEGEADYTKGNRLFTGEAWQKIPRNRYLGNSFLSLLTKIASGYWHLADSQSGFTAISLRALRILPLEKLYPRYGYPNHLLVMLNIYSFRVQDVPITPVYGIGEESGIRLRKVIPTLSWLLLKCFFWRLREKYVIRDFHPLIFFYTIGGLLLMLGLALGSYLIGYRFTIGRVSGTSALFATILFLSGLQLTLFATWFDMEYNRHLR
jgi:glycosyltransferase involved in cell wall biosynthesis